jgi:hypothetical protein
MVLKIRKGMREVLKARTLKGKANIIVLAEYQAVNTGKRGKPLK